MKPLKEYHHFKRELIEQDDRLAKCERYVVDLLLTSSLPDSERESSICWELKHQASMRQFAAILAQKRGLPVDICIIGALLHDIYSLIHGKYAKHAHQGSPIALEILSELGGFSDKEIDQIQRIIYNHSDKHIWTDDPFVEFGKDIDVLDCFLYEGAFDYYLGNKPLPIFKEYLKRAKKIWRELGLPSDSRFKLLDSYNQSWFERMQVFKYEFTKIVLAIFFELSAFDKELGVCPPPFCILIEKDQAGLYANRKNLVSYTRNLSIMSNGPIREEMQTVLCQVLKEILKKNSDKNLLDKLFSLTAQLVAEANIEQATSILEGGKEFSSLQKRALVFWPLIDIYELLRGKEVVNRLEGFGINLQPSI